MWIKPEENLPLAKYLMYVAAGLSNIQFEQKSFQNLQKKFWVKFRTWIIDPSQ